MWDQCDDCLESIITLALFNQTPPLNEIKRRPSEAQLLKRRPSELCFPNTICRTEIDAKNQYILALDNFWKIASSNKKKDLLRFFGHLFYFDQKIYLEVSIGWLFSVDKKYFAKFIDVYIYLQKWREMFALMDDFPQYTATLAKKIEIIIAKNANNANDVNDANDAKNAKVKNIFKYFPKERSSFDRRTHFIKYLCSGSITRKYYRTKILPKRKLYERPKNIIRSSKNINIPSDIVKTYVELNEDNTSHHFRNEAIESQWNALLEHYKIGNAIVVSDISANMRETNECFSPINISVGFGLLFAQLNNSMFANQLIISSKYTWIYHLQGDLMSNVENLFKHNSTTYDDLMATLNFISEKIASNFRPMLKPSSICIITNKTYDDVNFAKFTNLPPIILWNVHSDKYPISFGRNVIKINGVSLIPIEILLSGCDFSIKNIMRLIVKYPFM
ncbi:MAG: DUF2828 family protein [Candidatus Aenigmarchaeota archaeon]|nr:DUF2828 family protein [Candidatus Aenigmarchaeota archaeon]